MDAENDDETDVGAVLDEIGFDPERSVLTRRQVEVLLLRQRGYTQAEVAAELGTSRPNVANVEASANENVAKARETVRMLRVMEAPVQVAVPAGMDIYDVPETVFEACDQAGIKVDYSAPELLKRILEADEDAVDGRTIAASLTLSVDEAGEVLIRRVSE